jgi:hypothetical protein
VRTFWRTIALSVAVLAGLVNAVSFFILMGEGDYFNAALAAAFVLMQPMLYRVMTS